MTYPKLPDELHNLEKSIFDCKNVIYDIEKSEKYADNLEEAVSAISTLYKVKFAELISKFNDMERRYIGLHESWHDMKPTLSEEESNRRMDIIGQNGNDGLHYDETEISLDRLTDTTQTLIVDKPEKTRVIKSNNDLEEEELIQLSKEIGKNEKTQEVKPINPSKKDLENLAQALNIKYENKKDEKISTTKLKYKGR